MKQIVQQVGGQKKLDKLLKEQAVTQPQLEEQLKAQMLQDAVQQKVYADIKVSEADLKKYFENPDNKSQFNVPESVDARHVLVKTKAEADEGPRPARGRQQRRELEEGRQGVLHRPGLQEQAAADLGNFPKGRMVKAVRGRGLRARDRRDLAAGQDAVRLPRHRGHQEDPGQQADLRGGQGDHRAAAQVPEAGHGLGELAQGRPWRPPASSTPPASTRRCSPRRRARPPRRGLAAGLAGRQ